MKIKFIIALFCAPLVVSSQKMWEGVDLGRIGYRTSTIVADFQGYDITKDSADNQTIELYPEGQMKIGSVPLVMDIFGNNFYAHIDASFLSLAIQALVASDRIDEKSQTDIGQFDYLEFLPLRLGFGGTFAKYFGLYVGGQWMYSQYQVTLHDQRAQYYGYEAAPFIIGGNQRGVGGHFMFGTGKFLLKYSGMYDWIRRDKRKHKGTAITHEFNLFVPLGSSKVGLFATYYYRTRKMESTLDTRIPIDFNSEDTQMLEDSFNLPEFSGTDTHLIFGIFAEGLLSGTTRTVTKSIEVAY